MLLRILDGFTAACLQHNKLEEAGNVGLDRKSTKVTSAVGGGMRNVDIMKAKCVPCQPRFYYFTS